MRILKDPQSGRKEARQVEDVPTVVVGHVRGALELGDDVELERAAVRSAKRHREFVRKRLGVVYGAARVRQIAEEAIRKTAQSKDDPADLINVALEELIRLRCELPGYTTLDAMAASIRTEVNTGFFQTVAGRLDAAARARLARLLVVDPVSRRSEFDRLKDVAKAASLSKFKERLALLADIEAIGPAGAWLQGVPPGKIGHFAGEARVTDAADMRKVTEDKRLTLIASLVHTAATGVRDDVVTMFCKRMAAIHKRGRDHLEALREAHRAESERLLGVFGDVLSVVREAMTPLGPGGDTVVPDGPASAVTLGTVQDVAERAGRLVLKTLEQSGGVRWPARTRRCRHTTATTTCRCWTSTTARTARRCSLWSRRSSWRPPSPSAACWRRWSSCGHCAAGIGGRYRSWSRRRVR